MKIGRNDPCPCGSGKKYKKCCLNSPPAAEAPSAVVTVPQAATRVHCRTSGVTVEVEKTYIISPLNPRKTKNRGRSVQVLGFLADEAGLLDRAEVKFLDTNRKGRVELEDLAVQA